MKPKKENKKGGAIVSLIVGIIFVLLAIMCFIGDMDYLLGGKAKDLNEIAANVRPQKDDHVRTDSYLVLGNFAETKHYINGIIPAGKEQHYAIVLGDDNMDDITDAKIIVLTVKNKKTIEKLDELAMMIMQTSAMQLQSKDRFVHWIRKSKAITEMHWRHPALQITAIIIRLQSMLRRQDFLAG